MRRKPLKKLAIIIMFPSKSLKWSVRRFFLSSPFPVPIVPVNLLPATEPVEEECAPHYSPKHFYPMHLYEVLNNRYQIAAKLGWGTSSTVWLARDLHQWRWLPGRYVAVKVNANNYASREAAETELRLTEHITKANPHHVGRLFVRTLLDSFDLHGPCGTHVCMVFDPLREPLWMLKRRFQGRVLPADVLRPVSKLVIEGLNYLHSQCRIIHTDLKSDNILMALRDRAVLNAVAQDEIDSPLPQKRLGDRTIYLSRNEFGLPITEIGRPVITDFGLAVHGDNLPSYYHLIQPDSYRAPEVILACGWSYSVDIWNLGVLIWDMLQGSGPFDVEESRMRTFSNESHLAHIIALLGPPPLDMLNQGKESFHYFDNEGNFKFPELIPKSQGLENLLSCIEGDERKMFLNFISRMLQWRPADRSNAEELLSDSWLQGI
ncbi:kinase domain protein [Xylona heveae TC161]|uniref:non-specific serine/threonine protein kinase n=1 Tax=Xylona heveae (strain CBS 132557 / TC161) TaxID=1328760 RepID=A0A165K0N6_XYLHT|nr:kinase domain protein [Xylona heveae TC161]KZF26857.1 kinase domain protein [Xylona heveae TC161]